MRINWRSLSVQLSSYLLLTVMALLTLFGVVTYQANTRIVLKKTEGETIAAVKLSSDYISDYLHRLQNILSLLVHNDNINKLTQQASLEREQEASELLTNLLAMDPSLVSAVLVTKDGRLLATDPALTMATSSNMMKESWYREAIAKKGMPVLASARKQELSPNQASWVISMTQEITDTEGRNLGVVRVDSQYDAITTLLSKLNLGKSGFSYILTSQDQLIYHKDVTIFNDAKRKAALLAISRQAAGYHRQKNELVYRFPIENTKWYLISRSSLDELTMITETMKRTVLLASLLLLMAVFFGNLLIIRLLVKPLEVLEHSMKNVVSTGMLEVKLKQSGAVEVQSLTTSFNYMVTQIKGLMAEGQKKEQAIKQYELQTLASQINPHFLYNTLDTIVWMAEFNDSQQVVKVTKSLASFFRLSLTEGTEMTTLKKEIDHIRQYLSIQQARYGEQLSFAIKEDAALFEYQLPKLVLQPLVENAIYHGLRESKRPGEIKIRTAQEGREVLITITDNGVGYHATKPTTSQKKLGGVGLNNVDERLRLQFGQAYRMDITSELDDYTTITLYLPR